MKPVRRTKIICTIGPASQDEGILREMIKSGMNVARLNFSHGTHEEHLAKLRLIRLISNELKTPVAILLDLCGPKIRLGEIPGGAISVKPGDEITIYTEKGDATQETAGAVLHTIYEHLAEDVKKGDRILIDDGAIELFVSHAEKDKVHCKVVSGGNIKSHKGLNLPGVNISAPSVTEKDKKDLEFGIKNKVDYVALSFVRSAEDVREIKKLLHKAKSDIQLIAKIERPEGVNNIEDILKESDGLMVARGDLGVEMELECVPAIQKRLLSLGDKFEKPVITATQMLESMIEKPMPTRAEVSDVANAILDGSDAIMLSGETAVGKFPLSALQMADKIARETEKHYFEHEKAPCNNPAIEQNYSLADAISHGVCQTVRDIGINLIVVSSRSGTTARFLSKYRSEAIVVGVTQSDRAVGKMCLDWGVVPFLGNKYATTEELISEVIPWAARQGLIKEREYFALVAGVPLGQSGATNTLELHQAKGNFLPRGQRLRETTFSRRAEGSTNYFLMDMEACIGCGICERRCPVDIYHVRSGKAYVNKSKVDDCLLDMQCVKGCPVEAIQIVPKKTD